MSSWFFATRVKIQICLSEFIHDLAIQVAYTRCGTFNIRQQLQLEFKDASESEFLVGFGIARRVLIAIN